MCLLEIKLFDLRQFKLKDKNQIYLHTIPINLFNDAQK